MKTLIGLLIFAGGLLGQTAFVPGTQNTLSVASGTSADISTVGSTTAGNTLILLITMAGGGTPNITSVSNTSGGCSWTLRASNASNRNSYLYQCSNAAGGATTAHITFSATVSAAIIANITEWGGMPTTTTLEGTPAGSSGTAASPVTATISPTVGDPVLLIGVVRAGGGSFTSNGAGWTALTTANAGAQFFYQIVNSASGSYSNTQTWPATIWGTVIGGFKGTASVAGTTIRHRVISQ